MAAAVGISTVFPLCRPSTFSSTPLPSSIQSLAHQDYSHLTADLHQVLPTIIKTAMCLRSSIDKFAFPCIYEAEGITTMPVCYLLSIKVNQSCRTNGDRYLVVVAPPVWSAETLSGSFPANAAHSAARLLTRPAVHVLYVLLRTCVELLLTC